MAVEIDAVSAHAVEFDRRLPFHFGNVKVAEGPQILLEAAVAVDETPVTGRSMGSLAPMWFHKDPGMTMAEGVGGMLEVVTTAVERAVELEARPTPFDYWARLYEDVAAWATDTRHPPLSWSYGVALVEQALLDAFCRLRETTFVEAVHENAFGIALGEIYDDLAGFEPTDLLPGPSREPTVRHTIGLQTPLTPADVAPSDRLDDGLPQAVSEYVEEQGLDHFKIKLAADARDAERLRSIHDLFRARGLQEYAFSLDANEGYDSVASFRRQWEAMQADDLEAFLEHLLYVEQPLPRGRAFSDDTRRSFAEWTDAPPVIIDESDHHLRSLETALDCGYAGTSHKNCKGVFKGIANRCLLEYRRRRDDGRAYVMSGEDLTVHGPITLQEDLAVMATLGMDNVERNGHHYYRGLTDFTDRTQTDVLEVHEDLYRRHDRGFATLDVTDGRITLDSVLDAPFGYAVDVQPSRMTPIEAWDVEAAFV
jgi:L-alanine-DL-glutamate epimerase-like enolase superfamily enzyme